MVMMNFPTYCQPHDIARRFLYAKPYWFHGNPKVKLVGENRSFGRLHFDFGDKQLVYRIWIKDREAILDSAHMAVMNFTELAQEACH